jgi:hypothetical protein
MQPTNDIRTEHYTSMDDLRRKKTAPKAVAIVIQDLIGLGNFGIILNLFSFSYFSQEKFTKA